MIVPYVWRILGVVVCCLVYPVVIVTISSVLKHGCVEEIVLVGSAVLFAVGRLTSKSHLLWKEILRVVKCKSVESLFIKQMNYRIYLAIS